MGVSVTQYTVLISAPSDINDEIAIVKKCFDKFNRGEGKRNRINLMPQYWKEDAYPEQGDKPQNILNRQIVDACDAIIAIFGTRFGTPTESYGSGTEEEIARLREGGKQIFLYFSEIKVDIYSIDLNQFEKVKNFKAKVQNEGVYGSYKTLQEFEDKLSKHLNIHFSNNSKLVNEDIKQFLSYIRIDLHTILSNKFVEATLCKTLETDYDEFLDVMAKNFVPEYDQEKKIYSIIGGVPGLFTIREGILEFKEDGCIYVAFTNGKEIKYYTNDDKYLQKIPEHREMKKWMKNRNFEQLIYFGSMSDDNLKAVSGEYKFQGNRIIKSIVKIEVREQIIKFKGHTNYGANVGQVEGEAVLVDGYLALYQDSEGNKLKFTFFNDKIRIEEQGRFGGNNATFQGEYDKLP